MSRAPLRTTVDAPRPLSVLLVDDELTLLHAMTRLLRTAGLRVTPCTNGAAAMEQLSSTERFDVIVSDLAMPGLDGISLLALVRGRAIDLPVVLLTGSPTLPSAIKAVEYRAYKYLTKPIAPRELISTITQAAKEHQDGGGSGRGDVAGVGPEHSTFEPGTLVAGRYRLRRALGSGGMGEVWEAVDAATPTPRSVALKLLHPSHHRRPEMRARMMREARAATAFTHPNVVTVFEVLELGDGTPVIVMELLHGETLRGHLDAHETLSIADACRIVGDVVSAVRAAHAHGVVHRDVKPENVMLCAPTGAAKVMDFGIAKLTGGDPSERAPATAVGVAVGTPGYMAPEQARGRADVDRRADVWSIGAILYESLAGVLPLSGTTLGEVIFQHLHERPVPLRERAPRVPAALAQIVDRMLARDPDERPDLGEVEDELARHADPAPPTGPRGGRS